MKNDFVDQIGRIVQLSGSPRRIVSLVPSITELLVDLGLQYFLVGVTKFCVHPAGLSREVTIVGGTKNIDIDVVSSLKARFDTRK